jgi:hypothetical protein
MTTMRQTYETYLRLYGQMVERGSITDALLRGAFSAGVVHGLGIAQLDHADAVQALNRMSDELQAFWEKESPDGTPNDDASG